MNVDKRQEKKLQKNQSDLGLQGMFIDTHA